MKRSMSGWLLLAGLGVLLACAQPQAAPPVGGRLPVCVDGENPPFSLPAAGGSGFDVDLARVIAQKLQREVEFFWVQIPTRGGLGKALKESIQAGRCDLFFGLPVGEETDADLARRSLRKSRPYLTLGYLLVGVPGSAPMTLNQARQARRVGAVTATPADLYLHKEKFNRVPYGNNRELVNAVRDGGVQAALLWGPALAALRNGTDAFVTASEQPSDPALRTNMVIALRSADRDLANAVDAAVAELIAGGELRALAGRHGLPWIEIN